MNIQNALKETGMTIKTSGVDCYAQEDDKGVLRWVEKKEHQYVAIVSLASVMLEDWQPYHLEKEIRPENAGELWEYRERFLWFTRHIRMESGELSEVRIVCQDGENETLQSMCNTIHNKNCWKRLYPPVKQEAE